MTAVKSDHKVRQKPPVPELFQSKVQFGSASRSAAFTDESTLFWSIEEDI